MRQRNAVAPGTNRNLLPTVLPDPHDCSSLDNFYEMIPTLLCLCMNPLHDTEAASGTVTNKTNKTNKI